MLQVRYNRKLGLNGGIATFTVEVPSDGGYAVNVAYVTKVTRNVSVKVNNCEVQKFEFDSSGEWCFNSGSSTVLLIELDGFSAGTNTITFGVDTTDSNQFIEWISVVIDKDNPTRVSYFYIQILHSIARAIINGDCVICWRLHTFMFISLY